MVNPPGQPGFASAQLVVFPVWLQNILGNVHQQVSDLYIKCKSNYQLIVKNLNGRENDNLYTFPLALMEKEHSINIRRILLHKYIKNHNK